MDLDSEIKKVILEQTAKKYYEEMLIEAFVGYQLCNLPFIDDLKENFEELDEKRIV